MKKKSESTRSTNTTLSNYGKLADAIGAQIREFRKQLKLTVSDAAKRY